MKLLKYSLVLVGAALISVSCFKNQYASSFSDKNAYIAFDNQNATMTMSVKENVGIAHIPVRLSSISGLSGSVKAQVIADKSTARAGEQYVDPGVVTLTFDKEHPAVNFDLEIIDNNILNPNTKVYIVLFDATGCQLGVADHITVTIVDDEHPLMVLFGTYNVIDHFKDGSQSSPYEISVVAGTGTTRISVTGLRGYSVDDGGQAIIGVADLISGKITITSNQTLTYFDGDGDADFSITRKIVWYDGDATTSLTTPINATIDQTSGLKITVEPWGVQIQNGYDGELEDEDLILYSVWTKN